jgi:hypothetical protein
MRPGGFRTGGSRGISDRRRRTPWRLRGFAAYLFRGPGRWRRDRAPAFVGEGVLSPLPGLAVHGGTEPSAHALGYHLTALRAWGHGFGGREAAEVYRDRTRFFSVSFRDRCRCRSRYRRVRRGVAGRVARTQGACLVGMLRRAKESAAMEVGRMEDVAFVLGFPFFAVFAATNELRPRSLSPSHIAEGRVPSPGACTEDRQFIAAKHPFRRGSILRVRFHSTAETAHAKGEGTRIGWLPVLVSLRPERSGREESI